MESGICIHSAVPVRREPAHTSEMVTQILFGELYRIIDKENNWLHIHLIFDDYEGWIHSLQSHAVSEPEFIRLAESETAVTRDLVHPLSHKNHQTIFPIVAGSSLPGLAEQRFQIDHEVFFFDGTISSASPPVQTDDSLNLQKIRQDIMNDAMIFINTPYLWGGRTPFGIDCSGFTQMVYKLQKIKLLRDAVQQSTQGEVISLLAEAESGDLAFFDDEEGKITHVGLVIDHSKIIHCSGKVRIDALDHEGIYDQDLQKYTHKLRLIKRIV